MTIQLRPYQLTALDELWRYWQGGGTNPLVEMATGTGKSLVIGELTRRLMTSPAPGGFERRVVILTHVQELLEQNEKAIRQVWPQAPVGIFCAGLKRREYMAPICLASRDSVHTQPEILGCRNLVIVDECHLIPQSGDGKYVRTLAALRRLYEPMRVAGFTATPYRLDCGRLDEGPNRLFDRTVYSYDIAAGITDGWLAPLMLAPTTAAIDTSDVGRNGARGDFVQEELADAAERVVAQAAQEIYQIGRTHNRRSWLVFCVGVPHAIHMRNLLREMGVRVAMVCGKTPKAERRDIFDALRAGEIEAVTGANVFTTGFDVPRIDFVALTRPTLSTGLFMQMIGRGTRLVWPQGFDANTSGPEGRIAAIGRSPKPNCLLADFGGNIERHGPLDYLSIHGHTAQSREKERLPPIEASGKVCPECNGQNSLNARACRHCNHLFLVPHEARSVRGALFSADMEWLPVDSYAVRHHQAPSSDKPSLQITYRTRERAFSEWLALEHQGKAKYIARHRWRQLGGEKPEPKTISEAIQRQRELRDRVEIVVRQKPDSEFFEVLNRRAV